MEYYKYPEMERFQNGLELFDITLTEKQKQQFVDYYELLVEWNKVMNLTAITDFPEVIEKHFIDSISLVKSFRPEKESIIDIGTGAGFPGIPLKIVFPDTNIVLLDSLNKRIKFLDEVILKLNLRNITTLHGRAEDFAHEKEYRESFDLCVSRAVAKLSVLSEYCIPFVKVGGFFIPYKSGQVEDEIVMSKNALKLLGAKIIDKNEFMLPDTDIDRTLITINKVASTQKQYPRTAGKPTKEPL